MAEKLCPKDVQDIKAILAEMGVKKYDPQVVYMLLELKHKYVTEVCEDARVMSQLYGKKTVDSEDIKTATKMKLEHTFTKPPPRELLLEISKTVNSMPLPPIKPFSGPKLPPDRYCLTNPNYELVAKKENEESSRPGKFSASLSMPGNLSSLGSLAHKRRRFDDDD